MELLRERLAFFSVAGSWQTLALDVVLRATLALAAAALLSVALRRASAAMRHLVWSSALAGALALPLLMLALPYWRVPILPQAKPAARPSGHDWRPALDREPMARPTQPLVAAGGSTGETIDPGPPAAESVGPRAATSLPAPMTASSLAGSGAAWVALVWGIGGLVVLLPLAAGHVRLWRLERQSVRATGGLLADVAETLTSEFRGWRRVVLLQGSCAISPITWGVLRPVILLPAGAESWPRERLRSVLLHELAHVTRWDCLTQMLARLACAAYWFHPLAWMASRRLRAESERACDDLVLRSGSRATDYAGHLLEVASALRSLPGLSAAAVPMARASQLEGRLRAILDRSRSRRTVSRRSACMIFAASAAVLVPLSAARLSEQAAASEPGDERPAPATTMTVSGRVLDPEGRPVPGSNVAILGRRKLPAISHRTDIQHAVMGRTTSDGEGRFRLEIARTSSVSHYELQVLASRPGFGLGWAELNRDADAPSADVHLKVEKTIEGRLVDLQGAPAGGVKLRISGLSIPRPEVGGSDGMSFWSRQPTNLDGVWPAPVVSDAEGRFRLAGIGRGVRVSLETVDVRFARQALSLATDEGGEPNRATLALQPAMRVAGRVTCADTGEPLRNTLVVVGSGTASYSAGGDEYRTDADGRYEANPGSGKFVRVTVYPPDRSPYLIFERNFDGGDGVASRVVDVAVPRGVLLTGRVTERGTGRPLAGAGVYYDNGDSNVVDGKGVIPGWKAAVTSDAEGRYAIAVSPGKGHLLFYGPTADFVYEMKGRAEIDAGKPGGQRNYAHAFKGYDVTEGQGPVTVDAALVPGATLEGRVVAPDGRPVQSAEIISTLYISPFHTFWRGDFTIPVREGRFELHGMPPDRTVKCSFLDARNGWGTTLELSAAMAARGPVTVKLEPSGTATARIVDENDRPLVKGTLSLNIVATPGPGPDYDGTALSKEERSTLKADEEIYANVDRLNYWEGPTSDREGRITLPKLIPRATYRIYEYTRGRDKNVYRWRDFTVEAGKTIDLGDVRMKTADG